MNKIFPKSFWIKMILLFTFLIPTVIYSQVRTWHMTQAEKFADPVGWVIGVGAIIVFILFRFWLGKDY